MKEPRKKQTNFTQQENDQQQGTGFDAEAVRRQAEEYAITRNRDARINEQEGITDPNVGWIDGQIRVNRRQQVLEAIESIRLGGGRPSNSGWVNADNAAEFFEFFVDKAKSIALAQRAVPTLKQVIMACDGKYGLTAETSERTVQRQLQQHCHKSYRDDVRPLIQSYLDQN